MAIASRRAGDKKRLAMHVGMQYGSATHCSRQLPDVPGARAHLSDTAECLCLTVQGRLVWVQARSSATCLCV